jgi:drug/metabolite transporter (DMT)-like permease
VAVLSALLLGEAVSAVTWTGIALCLVGVVILATKGDRSTLRSVLRARGDRAMWAGITAGGAFGLATICIRSASTSLGTERPIVRALVTLAVMNVLQTVANAAWLAWRAPAELVAIRARLSACTLVGLLSVCGSAGWAIAVTLQNAAIVRTVGQVDLVLAFVVGRFVFHEPRRRSELLGAATVVTGVAVVLLV